MRRRPAAYRQAIDLRQSLVAEFPAVAKYRLGLAQSYNNLGTAFDTSGEAFRSSFRISQGHPAPEESGLRVPECR